MKNVLIFSNNAASISESNGRIHMTHFQRYLSEFKIHNFFVRGNPDLKEVKYLSVPYKTAIKSKLLFGLKKLSLEFNGVKNNSVNNSESISKKSFHPFYHWARNCIYFRNKSIKKALFEYITDNKIDCLVLWGCNIPFLYRYVNIISKKLGTKHITITCEDYPLKDYCYFKKQHSLFFRPFQKKLKKECTKCYLTSERNIYTNEDLKDLYEKCLNINNGETIYFGSDFKKTNNSDLKDIKNVFYGGNLYLERIRSLAKVSESLKDTDCNINVYGHCSNEDLKIIKRMSNVKYHGLVSYEENKKAMMNSDLLLFIEGFSKEYVKDCRYAFSTKISDYLMTGKPLFFYGPESISGIKFAKTINNDFVSCDENKCDELKLIIKNKEYERLLCHFNTDLFDTVAVSNKIFNIIEEI